MVVEIGMLHENYVLFNSHICLFPVFGDSVPNYPTAALSENAFGQAPGKGAGPACGKCYRLKIYGSPHNNVRSNTLFPTVTDLTNNYIIH